MPVVPSNSVAWTQVVSDERYIQKNGAINSSSYAFTASVILDGVPSSSYAVSASVAVIANSISFVPTVAVSASAASSSISASFAANAINAQTASAFFGSVTSASYAKSASYVPNPSIDTILLTGSTTADFQAALDKGGTIWIQKGNYTVSNLQISKSVSIYGNNATLNFSSSATGFMLDTGIINDIGGKLVIENLVFNGGNNVNFNDVAYFSTSNGSIVPLFNPNWVNRSGLRVDCFNGGIISNCLFTGFSGNGVLLTNRSGSLSQEFPRLQFNNNTCHQNFIGIFATAAQWETQGYYNNPSGQWVFAQSEYTIISNNVVTQCQFGIIASSGNCVVTANTSTDNYIGLHTGPGSNPTHGIYGGNSFNHCVYAIWSESNFGGLYSDNVLIASQHVFFNNVQEIKFIDNFIGGSPMTMSFTNSSSGIFKDNYYEGKWGTDFLLTSNSASTVTFTGNHSNNVLGDSDNTSISLIENSFTGSIPITASWSNNAVTASNATVANSISFVPTVTVSASIASSSISASYAPVEPAYSASVSSKKQDTLVTGNTYNITASWSNNAKTASVATIANAISFVPTVAVSASIASSSVSASFASVVAANGSQGTIQFSNSGTLGSVPNLYVDLQNSRSVAANGYQVLVTGSAGDITSNLILYYKLDEGTGNIANDSSGNGRNGSLANSPAWVTGTIGPYALRTSNINDHIDITPLSMVGSWTVSTWTLFPQPPNSGVNALLRDGAASGSGNIHVVSLGSKLGVYMSSDGTNFHDSGYDVSSLSGWHLLTAVGSGGTTTFYIDAVSVGTSTAQATDNLDTIGNNIQDSAQSWGTFDDFRIYNRALSTTDIISLYAYRGGVASGYVADSPSGSAAGLFAKANVILGVSNSSSFVIQSLPKASILAGVTNKNNNIVSFSSTGSVFSVPITGSLNGTASYALTASALLGSIVSASYALSASYAPGSPSVSSSYALTASFALNGGGSSLTTGSTYQITSSWANNAKTASLAIFAATSSLTSHASTADSATALTTAHGNISDNAVGLQVFGSCIFNDGLYDPVSGVTAININDDHLLMDQGGLTSLDFGNKILSGDWTGSISNAKTASYAGTASVLLGTITSASYALSSSYSLKALSASYAASSSVQLITSSSFASSSISASYLSGSNAVVTTLLIANISSSGGTAMMSFTDGGDVVVNSNANLDVSTLLVDNIGTLNGPTINTDAPWVFSSTVTANTFIGNVQATSITASGITSNTYQFSSSFTTTKTGSYTISNADDGKFVVVNSASAVNITLTTSSISSTFNATYFQSGSGVINFLTASNSVILRNRGNHTGSAGQYAMVSIVRVPSGDFVLGGDIA